MRKLSKGSSADVEYPVLQLALSDDGSHLDPRWRRILAGYLTPLLHILSIAANLGLVATLYLYLWKVQADAKHWLVTPWTFLAVKTSELRKSRSRLLATVIRLNENSRPRCRFRLAPKRHFKTAGPTKAPTNRRSRTDG